MDFSDLVAKRFGKLVVLEVYRDEKKRVKLRCLCDCGNETEVYYSNVRAKRTVSCGCVARKQALKYNDILGKVYGNLVVKRKTEKRKDRSIIWECECKLCGRVIEVTKKQLDRGYVTDCGNHAYEDLIGKSVGELFVESFDAEKKKYLCKCSCGKEVYVRRCNLVSGHTKSCGHLQNLDNFERIDGVVPQLLKSKLSKRNTSGVKGVSFLGKKWIAYITLKNKRYSLGTFEKKTEAVKARRKAEEELFEPILKKYKKKERERKRKEKSKKGLNEK